MMEYYLPQISQSIDQSLNSLRYIYPELALGFIFIIVILAGLFLPRRLSQVAYSITLAGILLVSILELLQLSAQTTISLFGSMLILSNSIVFFKLIFVLTAFLFLVFTHTNPDLQKHKKGTTDLYAILIAVLLGMNLMAMSANLLMIYLSIEMVSIGSYLMVGYASDKPQQTEASMKYAIFGATCSACMLYGMSLLYGLTGTLDLFDPSFINGLSNIPALNSGVALAMLLVGIGFKLSVVPFHFWSPDVYEGAPTPVTAFLSTGPKVAGFALLLVFLSAFKSAPGTGVFDFETVLGIAAIASMIAGNFSAIWQDNVKRMLAYSSIGNTGFLMMGVIAYSESTIEALLFYLVIYVLMNMAAFMLADHIEQRTGATDISAYKGLGRQMPLTFFLFVIVLISLIGIPATAGFISKFLVFSVAFEAYQQSGSTMYLALMITGAVATLISLFYYFKIPLNAYLRASNQAVTLKGKAGLTVYVSVFIGLLLILFGIFPQFLTNCLQ